MPSFAIFHSERLKKIKVLKNSTSARSRGFRETRLFGAVLRPQALKRAGNPGLGLWAYKTLTLILISCLENQHPLSERDL